MDLKDITIGTDIENIERFKKYAEDKNDPFVKRIYSDFEIEYSFSHKFPENHLAARFSAKEAVYKALCSAGINDVQYSEIEILNTEKGVPSVKTLKKYPELIIKLSLSHGNGNALATALVIIH